MKLRAASVWALTTCLVGFSLLGGSANAQKKPAHPYTVTKLNNGLEIIALEDHKVPLVTIVLAVKAGAMTETPDINGLTHLWEHMFFKGNKRLPNQEAFQRRIRQLGIVYNGDTSAEKVRYYFTMPSSFLDDGLQFMADAIMTPLLEKNELERERRVVLDEYDRNASQPGFELYKIMQNQIYGDQAHLRDPLGIRKVIETATRQQLLRIKDEVFVPANSAILVSGDFDSNKLIEGVKKYFSDWTNPQGWQPAKPNTFPTFPATTEIVMTKPLAQNVDIDFMFQGPKARENPQDTFAGDVLSSLVGMGSGKFYAKFVDSGMCMSAGISYYTQWQAGEINLTALTTPEKAVQARKELLAEINEWIKPGYFTEDQLNDVRRSLRINHKRELNSPSAYIKTLAFWWPVTGLDYYGSYLDSLSKITLKDVHAFVKKYLIKQPYLSAILISPEGAKVAGLTDNSKPYLEKLQKKN